MPGWRSRSRSRPRSTCSEPLEQRARRAAAVRDRVLLGVVELGHRAAVAVVGHEQRVVAEAAARRAALGAPPRRSQRALEQVLGAVGRRRGRSRRRSAAPCPAAPRARSLARFSASVAVLARRSARSARPGAPPSAVGLDAGVVGDRGARRSAGAAARALISAFSANVSPSSGGELDAVGQRVELDARAAAARTRAACARCGWRARAAPMAGATRQRRAWTARSSSIPCCGERQQVVEVGARERRALGGRLDLDEAAVAGHDDVGVDLGGRVLRVVEVEQRHAVDDAARDGGDACRSAAVARARPRRPAARTRARARRSRR